MARCLSLSGRRIQIDHHVAALLPIVLRNRAVFGAAGVVNPVVDVKRLMKVAKGDVVDVRPQRRPLARRQTACFFLQLAFDAGVGHKDVILSPSGGQLRQRFGVRLHGHNGAGAVVAQAMDAHAARQIDVGALAAHRVPGTQLRLGLHELGIEEDDKVLQRQKFHPADRFVVVGAFVVAFHRDTGNAGSPQTFEPAHGLVERQCIDRALVKQVACQDDKINSAFEGLIDDRVEGAAEIIKALFMVILLVAEVNIGTV